METACAPSQPSRVGGHIDATCKNNDRLNVILESLISTKIRLLGNVPQPAPGAGAVSARPSPSGTLAELQDRVIQQSQIIDEIEAVTAKLSEI